MTPRSLSLVLSTSIPAMLIGAGGYERRWMGDDGFINLRVVAQLLAGNGFVINAGERAEAVTSAAWVLLLWGLGRLGFDVASAAWVVSLGLSVLGVALAALASARLLTTARDPRRTWILPFGMLAYAALPVAWDYATSGLENGLGLGFLGASYFLLARVATGARRGAHAIALFVGLAPLVRPDYVLHAAPLILLLLACVEGLARRAQVAACAALPGLSFQLFRMGYFAALVPNTAIAKEAFAARWDQGLAFLKNTFVTYGVIVPLLCVVVAAVPLVFVLMRGRAYARALLIASLAGSGFLHLLYVVRLGGDFMHGRMLLPGLFALLSSVGVLAIELDDAVDSARNLTLFAVLAGWAFVCVNWLRAESWEYESILDERAWYALTSQQTHPTRLEDYREHEFQRWAKVVASAMAAHCEEGEAALRPHAAAHCNRLALPDAIDGSLIDHPPAAGIPLNAAMVGPSVLGVLGLRPIGIAGCALGVRISIVDSYGLADPLAARMELYMRGRAGHEKSFPTFWFAAKYGDLSATSDPAVATARRALGCGLLAKLHAATHEPLSWQRFWKNVRLSFKLHGLRVPADPGEAVSRFCRR